MNLHQTKKNTKNGYKLSLKPWITKQILTKCKNRDSLLRSISKETDPVVTTSLRNDYKKLRNEITNDKRESKKAHFTAYFENCLFGKNVSSEKPVHI